MASSGTGLLVFTEDRSSRIHSEVYRATLSGKKVEYSAMAKSIS